VFQTRNGHSSKLTDLADPNLVRQEDQGTVAPQGTLLARPIILFPGKSYKAPGHVPVEELAIFETSRLLVE
jgi:hypothetical protein